MSGKEMSRVAEEPNAPCITGETGGGGEGGIEPKLH